MSVEKAAASLISEDRRDRGLLDRIEMGSCL